MTIEKLKSGSYRISQTHKGKRYRITVDYKPTKYEAQKLITAEIEKVPVTNGHMTFSEAAEAYLTMKSNILSPSTIKSYSALLQRFKTVYSPSFATTKLEDVNQIQIQTLLNDYAGGRTPKSVRVLYGFITAVLNTYTNLPPMNIALPQPSAKEPYIPTDDDIKKILSAFKDTDFEVPLMLAVFGLRLSEICALDLSDFDFEAGTVYVHKARLQDKDGKWIIVERNKTPKSTRTVFLPEFLLVRIKEKGCIFSKSQTSITKRLYDMEDALGIPRFSVHKLRHYFASMSHAQGVPEAYILEQGGWSSPNVMKRVYRHALMDEQKKMASKALSHAEQLFSG